jgi:hypothetical protein
MATGKGAGAYCPQCNHYWGEHAKDCPDRLPARIEKEGPKRLFIISDEQLLELYDCVMDGNLPKFEKVMDKIKNEQEVKVG